MSGIVKQGRWHFQPASMPCFLASSNDHVATSTCPASNFIHVSHALLSKWEPVWSFACTSCSIVSKNPLHPVVSTSTQLSCRSHSGGWNSSHTCSK